MKTLLYLFAAFSAVTISFSLWAQPKSAEEFHLKTKAIGVNPSSVGTPKDGLYVSMAYVGGADDIHDVTLSKDKSLATKLCLNNTYVLVEMETPTPWGISPLEDPLTPAAYVGWAGLKIVGGYGRTGFYFNDTDLSAGRGLKWNSGYGRIGGSAFGGWLGRLKSEALTARSLYTDTIFDSL